MARPMKRPIKSKGKEFPGKTFNSQLERQNRKENKHKNRFKGEF